MQRPHTQMQHVCLQPAGKVHRNAGGRGGGGGWGGGNNEDQGLGLEEKLGGQQENGGYNSRAANAFWYIGMQGTVFILSLQLIVCGRTRGCKHSALAFWIQDFLGLAHEQHCALTFKSRAPPTVTLNLYYDLPAPIKAQIPPR